MSVIPAEIFLTHKNTTQQQFIAVFKAVTAKKIKMA